MSENDVIENRAFWERFIPVLIQPENPIGLYQSGSTTFEARNPGYQPRGFSCDALERDASGNLVYRHCKVAQCR